MDFFKNSPGYPMKFLQEFTTDFSDNLQGFLQEFPSDLSENPPKIPPGIPQIYIQKIIWDSYHSLLDS